MSYRVLPLPRLTVLQIRVLIYRAFVGFYQRIVLDRVNLNAAVISRGDGVSIPLIELILLMGVNGFMVSLELTMSAFAALSLLNPAS